MRVYEGFFHLRDQNEEEVLNAIEDSKAKIQPMMDIDIVVYQNFYKLQAEYYFNKEDLEEYYKNGIMYLNFIR